MRLPKSGLIPWLLMAATPVLAQINAGTLPATASPPFKVSKVAQFDRSEEHTSELQSHSDVVCRLLLEKNNIPNPAEALPSFVYGPMAKAGKGLLEGTVQA